MIKKISKEYKESKPKEVWVEGVLYNTIYGFLGAVVIVALTLKIDIAVLLAYLAYYFFLGKVVNRPKYVTSLGKFIVFPIPTTLGAFMGYKMAPYLITLIQ
jgi:hypothetical protein|tara:strand:- start:318 stop:620 length:303 start_codon:yes stop_codon:yes gene_type:complete